MFLLSGIFNSVRKNSIGLGWLPLFGHLITEWKKQHLKRKVFYEEVCLYFWGEKLKEIKFFAFVRIKAYIFAGCSQTTKNNYKQIIYLEVWGHNEVMHCYYSNQVTQKLKNKFCKLPCDILIPFVRIHNWIVNIKFYKDIKMKLIIGNIWYTDCIYIY